MLMEKSSICKIVWPLSVSVLVLLALALMPFTGWLVREQVGMQFGLNDAMVSLLRDLGVQSDLAEKKPNEAKIDFKAVADKFPQDFQIQLAYLFTEPEGGRKIGPASIVERLRNLESRFPDNPSLFAQE